MDAAYTGLENLLKRDEALATLCSVLHKCEYVCGQLALVRPGEDRLVTLLFLRRNFTYGTLQTAFRWYHSLTDHDDTLVATLRYALNNDTSAYLSSEWFSGTAEGILGQFAGQDRVYIGITRYF